jgi:hypothetical protein
MKTYSTFNFPEYSWNHHAGKISLKYTLDNSIYFEELLKLPEPVTDERLKEKQWEIERTLFALHMIGGISYFKTCLPKKIVVRSGDLTLPQTKFWNTVYEHGLGEFFFRNDIDFRGLIKFPVIHSDKATSLNEIVKSKGLREKKVEKKLNRVLVPIGGGKDSMVTIELLKKAGLNVTLLRMEPHPIIDELAYAAGLPILTVQRSLSPNLFDLNKQGALNGHVPITAYLSIVATLVAIIYDFDAVVMSNEQSANYGNVEFKGLEINHQWSKSLQFEKLFRRYIVESIESDVEYFSALRPFSELKITEIFSKYPQYFSRVTSCNKNWRILEESETDQKWCGSCPKCAFVFACMAAYLDKDQLKAMFGSILYDNESLIPLFQELLGIKNFKPFECVGTPEETAAAFFLAHKRGDLNKTAVMKMFEQEMVPITNNSDVLIYNSLKLSDQHCIPTSLEPLIIDPVV